VTPLTVEPSKNNFNHFYYQAIDMMKLSSFESHLNLCCRRQTSEWCA